MPPRDTSQEETYRKAERADVYLSSVNAIAETGEILNIDGTGNRVAATLYGHKKLYLVTGINKIAADYDAALWRARNIASPKNAQRLQKKTPCALRGDKCYDCSSPDRICRGLVVLWEPVKGIGETEVVLIGETHGLLRSQSEKEKGMQFMEFEYNLPVHIVFGRGCIEQLGSEAAKLGKRALWSPAAAVQKRAAFWTAPPHC